MIKRFILCLVLVISLGCAMQSTVGAVDLFRDTCSGSRGNGNADNSTVCQDEKEIANNPGKKDNPIYGPNGIITTITNILTAVVAIGAVISIIYGGTKLIFSGTNPQEANSARERIIYACIAIVFVVIAQLAVRFVINRIDI